MTYNYTIQTVIISLSKKTLMNQNKKGIEYVT